VSRRTSLTRPCTKSRVDRVDPKINPVHTLSTPCPTDLARNKAINPYLGQGGQLLEGETEKYMHTHIFDLTPLQCVCAHAIRATPPATLSTLSTSAIYRTAMPQSQWTTLLEPCPHPVHPVHPVQSEECMPQERMCNRCGEVKSIWNFGPASNTCKLCQRIDRHNQRAGKLGAVGTFTAVQWKMLCDKHGYRCVKCRKLVDVELMTIDHIIPMMHGGTNTINNVQPMCSKCNSGKRDR
jgi:hypothetical protein